jgi:ATP-dependent Zn protease
MVAHGDFEERFLKTPTEARDLIVVALAGRAAERMEYGEASSGISSDLVAATNVASQLVGQLGNGPGLLSLEAAALPTAANLVAKVLADEPSREAAEAFLTDGAERADMMVSKYRDALLDIANGLCESDELEGNQIRTIVASYADISERRGPVRIARNRGATPAVNAG